MMASAPSKAASWSEIPCVAPPKAAPFPTSATYPHSWWSLENFAYIGLNNQSLADQRNE
jgi:hypothetical protein